MRFKKTLSPAQMFYGLLDPKHQYMVRSIVAGVPVVGDLYRSYDNMRYMEDYLRNRGLSWSDIRYTTRTQGMQGVGSTLNYLSRNILRLYR